ncbi:unnamed protein product, partial [Didymodactylos carnosus]
MKSQLFLLYVLCSFNLIKYIHCTCYGTFELCTTTQDCVLDKSLCGKCSANQYLCPDGKTCIMNVNDYQEKCPGLSNTHLDWTLSTEARVEYLISQLTVNEKIAQLTNNAPAIVRMGIPSYNWLNDDVHSVMQQHSTVFPDGCGLGATWSRTALLIVGQTVGIEARGTYNYNQHQGKRGQDGTNGLGISIYGPNMNLVRDPRWGRNQEVYSEDPYLSSQLTVHFVGGAQGKNFTDSKYKLVAACCKHYAAYDVETNRFEFDAQVNVRNMWETYLPVFDACVNYGQVMSIMCSYNAINNIPTCGNPDLLNGILRERWN